MVGNLFFSLNRGRATLGSRWSNLNLELSESVSMIDLMGCQTPALHKDENPEPCGDHVFMKKKAGRVP
jgi:hypothetical protein